MNERQETSSENTDGIMDQNNVNNISTTPVVAEETNFDASMAYEDKNQENSNVEEDKNNLSEPLQSSKLSTVLLILLFVFLFAFVMLMPNIRQFIQELKSENSLSTIEKEALKEEKRQENEENKQLTTTPEDEKLLELVCTSTSNMLENYTLVETQKFYYNSKNQVLSSVLISNYNFKTLDEIYNSLKQQCDQNSLKYLTHDGYTLACSYDAEKIEISHEFDLEVFKPIISDTTNIQANAIYKESIDTIKNRLISNGYTCK